MLMLLPPCLRAQEPTAPPTVPQETPEAAAAPATFELTGAVHSGKTPLPGATVTAANTLTAKKYVAATNSEGKFTLSGMTRGRYVVRVEFMGFAVFTQEVVLNPENPSAKVDAELILASRQQEQSNNANNALVSAGRGFQSLAMENTLSALAGGNGSGGFSGANGAGGGQAAADLSSLPLNGAGAEGPTESVSISGAQGRTQDFGSFNEDELQQRIQEFRERMQREHGLNLLVHVNEEGLARGINPFDSGSVVHTDVMKTEALKQALDLYGFDAAFGGGQDALTCIVRVRGSGSLAA